MGYTHYYYTSKEFDFVGFNEVVRDFKKMIPVLEHLGVKLANACGDDKPIINGDEITFNGLTKCGHQNRDLGITWPKPTANGVLKNGIGTKLQQITQSNWFAGAQLESRVCGGDCSHETFSLERTHTIPDYKQSRLEEGKLIFECTKTAYKPYDLAVNVALIIASHRLGNQIKIGSDGEMQNWEEAIQLCEHFLGYGKEFNLKFEDAKPETDPNFKEPTRKEPEKVDKTTIKIGDVFVQSWGYDQTNIDYIKVVGFTPSKKSARVVTIGAQVVKTTGSMSDNIKPDPESVVKNSKTVLLIDRSRVWNEEAHEHQKTGEILLKGAFYPSEGYKRSGGYFHKQEGIDYRSSYA